MQGPTYIFALQDENDKFWRVNTDGSVSLSAQPYFLEFSPAGWDDISIQNVRNRQYWGIDRTVTIPLTYIQDGAKIIKHVAYSTGLESKLFLTICVLSVEYNPGVDYGYWYKQIYKGEVNTTDMTHQGPKVTCTTVKDGLPKHMKANQGTVYELPMNVPEAVMVKMDGIRLRESLKYADLNGFDIEKQFYGTQFFGGLTQTGRDGDSTGVLYRDQELKGVDGLTFEQKLESDNFLLQNLNSSPISFTISGRIEIICTGMVSSPAYGFRCRFLKSTQLIADQNDYEIFTTGTGMVVGQTYSDDFSLTIELQPNERLYLERIFFGASGTNVKIQFTEASKFTIDFITRRPATYVPHLPGQYIMQQLINRMTGGEYSAAESAYLQLHADKLFTCGNAIRGLADPVLKIKFTDFFKWWDSFDNVGLKVIGNTVDIARKADLIDLNSIIELPAPAYGSFRVSVAKDYLFNEVEIGYPEIKSDVGALNGNQEFNCKFLYSIGTVKNPAKIDKVSPLKASCYEQEKIRTTIFDKTTSDYKSDNDVFVNVVNTTLVPAAGDDPAHYTLDRSLNGSVTSGLLEPETVWNLAISPARMLENNKAFIRSCTYRMDGRTLAFQSADKNASLVCGGITERADVLVGDMGTTFFMPWVMDGEFPAPDDLLETLDTNPLQVFRFTLDGNEYIGIMNKVSIAHATRKVQDYQFLSAASNDFTQLINYFG